MSKLIFTYGTMGSAKTVHSLIKYFELERQGKKVLLMKSSTDTRDGIGVFKRRVGLERKGISFDDNESLREIVLKHKGIQFVVVDEAQFLKTNHVNELKYLAVYNNITVYVFGLKTNFMSELFEGTKRLMELADETRTLDMTCMLCDNPAEINARFDSKGKIIKEGAVVDIGGNEKYKALCYKCWNDEIIK